MHAKKNEQLMADQAFSITEQMLVILFSIFKRLLALNRFAFCNCKY